MKTDRFMRVMLVIIALLLGANGLKDVRNPLKDNAVEAAPPVFLQVGKKYSFITFNTNLGEHIVQEIDANGWIKLDTGYYYNTNQIVMIRPR